MKFPMRGNLERNTVIYSVDQTKLDFFSLDDILSMKENVTFIEKEMTKIDTNLCLPTSLSLSPH